MAVRRADLTLPGPTLEVGAVRLDCTTDVLRVGERSARLPRQESRLLALLMSNHDRLLTRDELLEHAWGSVAKGDSGTLAVHVLRLRRRLRQLLGAADHLRTVRGIGYVFDTEPL